MGPALVLLAVRVLGRVASRYSRLAYNLLGLATLGHLLALPILLLDHGL